MRLYLAILAVLCWSTSVFGTPLSLPTELCLASPPAELRLLDDLSDGKLDDHSLLEAALVAAGADEPQVDACRQAVAEQIRIWHSAGLENLPLPSRAERLFGLMHATWLRGGYHSDASSLADAIQLGRFNCVSATLLWQHLAAEFGITTFAQQLPGHMQSVLMTADGRGRQLIETTCPQWFSEPQTPTTAESGAAEARQLNGAELIASVYYNRGLIMMAQGHFPEALAATYTAHRLDPENTAARGNLLAILNNWSLRLAEEGQHGRAIAILEISLALAPEHESFAVNLKLLRGAQAK